MPTTYFFQSGNFIRAELPVYGDFNTRGLRLEPTRAFAMTHAFACNAALESLAEQHMDELEADAIYSVVVSGIRPVHKHINLFLVAHWPDSSAS